MFNSKFLKIYNLVMQDINSTRKSIRKVDAMQPHEFIEFLKQFLPYVKNGTVDLNDVRITEKVDGCAISLAWIDNDMKFQSSYSGVTTWQKLPYPEAGKFLYETYQLIFRDIAEQFGNFKIKGQLIWINGMQENGKVTPVGASYLTNKFGQYGGIVVFQIMKIVDNMLTNFSQEEQQTIMGMIQDMNNDEFSFYLSQDILLNNNVKFTLNVDELLQIVNSPEFNKPRFNKVEDAKILEEIKKIQFNVCAQLSQIIDNSRGTFSAEGDLIEGIVLKINNSGNQYGIFSNGYKDMKHTYWELFEQVKPIYNDFLKRIYGKSQIRSIKMNWNTLDKVQAQNTLNEIKPEYIQKETDLINQIKAANIPSSVKNTQVSMAIRILNKIINLNNIEQIIEDN